MDLTDTELWQVMVGQSLEIVALVKLNIISCI